MASHNIVVLFDGTLNEPSNSKCKPEVATETNVYKLFEACKKNGLQHVYYLSGVGTDVRSGGSETIRKECGLPNAPRWFEKMRGGLFGSGIKERVLEAYGIICSTYMPSRGDKLYVFGFSRGAFAARSLINFVDKVGILFDAERENKLIKKENCSSKSILNFVKKSYEIYENSTNSKFNELDTFLKDIFSESVINRDRELWMVKTHYLGVWDTVATKGWPRKKNEFLAARTEYVREAVPASVMRVRHALAAHEFRRLFEPLMFWETGDESLRVEQKWFAGSHADVGGGYSKNESGLSIEPLHWIVYEAIKMDLQVDLKKIFSKDETIKNVIHLEGINPKTTVQKLQAHTERKVRKALRLAAAKRRLILQRPTKLFMQDMQHTNANLVGESVRNIFSSGSDLMTQLLSFKSKDIGRHIRNANRSLLRILSAENGNLYDIALKSKYSAYFQTPFSLDLPVDGFKKGTRRASLNWAFSVLMPSDMDKIYQLLSKAESIEDCYRNDRRDGPPLFSRLLVHEQIELAAIAMVCSLEPSLVYDSFDNLESAIKNEIRPTYAGYLQKTLASQLYWISKVMTSEGLWFKDREYHVKNWLEILKDLQEIDELVVDERIKQRKLNKN